MYSRTYGYIDSDRDEQKERATAFTAAPATEANFKAREAIPVETFHDSVGEAQFRQMYDTPPFLPNQYARQEERIVPPPCDVPPVDNCATCPLKEPPQKGPLGFLDGFFSNINFDDIILVGLIVLFLFDNDKENDFLTPIMLAILLFL